MPRAEQAIDIAASPPQVLATLTDFAAYPTFLPEIRSATILHQALPPLSPAWDVRFLLQMIRPLSYTLRLTCPDPLHLEWTLLEGAFRANDGGWSLAPLADGTATRATYRIELQLGLYVPGNILHSLVDTGLPQTLARFKAEAERRALPGSDPGGG